MYKISLYMKDGRIVGVDGINKSNVDKFKKWYSNYFNMVLNACTSLGNTQRNVVVSHREISFYYVEEE
ncbi:MAG: hypothetical protein WA061_02550 [Microgenomates group bacterium]